MDAVQRATCGHPGLPMGCAAMAHTLWTQHLRYDPRDPNWINRDRFILSAGHGSMLLYAMLYLTGYDLSLDDIKNFRQWGSKTPGHPENTLTPGVEMATGPLGQGFATAVGMAIAERFLAARYNKPEFPIIDHRTYVIASDGDLMEGVAQEAASLAGHLRLGKLIVLYDDNQITIDGSTAISFTDDTAKIFEGRGWRVLRCNGLDAEEVHRNVKLAEIASDLPTLIICRTIIGYGSPNKQGTSKAHGAALGAEEVRLAKEALGLPPDQDFYVPSGVLDFYRDAGKLAAKSHEEWTSLLAEYEMRFPADAKEFEMFLSGKYTIDWEATLPAFSEPMSTRQASEKVLQSIASTFPCLIGGSADLAESVFTTIKGGDFQSASVPEGRNIAFGVREHAMLAAVNGVTLHGITRGYGGTFLIFSDYCKPSIRLAALMEVPSIFVFSHDSIGLGEDGPTHQPVEQLAGLRAIPNLNVMRPADANETAVCWRLALESKHTPCLIALTRQSVPIVSPPSTDEHPATRGAYVLRDAEDPEVILVATGSEVALALASADKLAAESLRARVVSMPSWHLFEQQARDYRSTVLPPGVPCISIEAAATLGWAKYAQVNIGIDHFGASAPAKVLFEEFGFTTEVVVNAARDLIASQA